MCSFHRSAAVAAACLFAIIHSNVLRADTVIEVEEEALGLTEQADTEDVVDPQNATATADALQGDIDVILVGTDVVDEAAIGTATATGVNALAGDDEITLSNSIDATADATANAGDVSVATVGDVSISSAWNGGAVATSTATGVVGADGADSLINVSTVTSTANSTSNAGQFSAPAVLAVTVLTTQSSANSTGLAGGEGNNSISNTGITVSNSFATANSASVDITPVGLVVNTGNVWEGGTAAIATSVGISAGAGADTIDSTNQLSASADSSTSATAVSATLAGVAIASVATTAISESTGIASGAGNDIITVDGIFNSTANSNAYGNQVAVAVKGVAAAPNSRWDDGTTSEATATGIQTGEGDDSITLVDSGVMTTTGNATTETAAASITLEKGGGVLASVAHALTNIQSLASVNATGIDAGDGDNTVENKGENSVLAESLVVSTEISLSLKGKNNNILNKIIGFLVEAAGSTSTATARGVVTGDGVDTITNTGIITANATATLPSLGVGLAMAGGPSVNLKSVVGSSATGIESGAGNDVVINGIVPDPTLPPPVDTSEISAAATSTAISLGVGVTGSGRGAVSGNLETTAATAGIQTGSGDDAVTNKSSITAAASASSEIVSFAANLGQPANDGGEPSKGKVKVSATSTAAATAVGVDTEGDKTSTFIDLGIDDDASSAGINFRYTEAVEADTDSVLNDGSITVSAAASATTTQAAGQQKGATTAKTKVSASSDALAIITGGGDDTITNNGMIDVDATSITSTASVAVVLGTGRAVVRSGGTGAASTATGIAGDSENRSFMIESIMNGDDDGSSIILTNTRAAASGDDTITNSGDMNVFAKSEAYGFDAAITSKNVSASLSAASSNSRSSGIIAGDGADVVANDGSLIAASEAITGVIGASLTADVGLAVAVSVGNSAIAESTGIHGDSDFSSLSNSVEITANSNLDILDGTVPDIGTLISSSSMEIRSEELSFGGNDTITNTGDLTVSTSAINVTGEVGVVATKGAAAVLANSEAVATTSGISGGGGDDSIDNTAFINTDAFSNADSLGISVTVAGVATAANKLLDGGSRASSSSVGIEGDGTSNAALSLVVTSAVDVAAGTFSSEITASSSTTSDDGVDTITNSGTINSTSVAVAPAISVAVSMRGVSGAISTATADAETAGIRAGGGADTVDNTGEIIVGAVAQADSVNITIAPAGVGIASNAVLDGGVVANSRAVGVDTDGGFSTQSIDLTRVANELGVIISSTVSNIKTSGDDVLTNDALVRARATSVVPSIAVSYSGSGVGVAVSTAESNAYAAALDTGGGNDQITNSEGVSAVATGNADTLNVGFANAGLAIAADAVWNGGATSIVDAIGINSDGEYGSQIETTTLETQYAVEGAAARITHETTTVMAAGDDIITNNGYVTAVATAVSPSIGVAVSPAGVSLVVTTATSNANAVSIDAGAGADEITNTAELVATSTANADVVSISYATGLAVAGDAVWDGGVTADSNASGIKAHGILSTTETLTLSTFDGDELVATSSETIDDDSDDKVTNSGVINATSNAATVDLNGAIAPYGVAVGVSTAQANSTAFGIETGAGADTVTNSNSINAFSNADAIAINITGTGGGVVLSGDAVWAGGTTATSSTDAIRTRAGDDTINNSGYLNVNSIAVGGSGSGSLAIYGVAGGSATSTATSDGTGIDAGAGVDDIINSNTIDVESVANADSLAVTLNWFGVSASAPDTWDGGTTSNAMAQGIVAGADNDMVTNNGLVDVRATSVTAAASVPATFGGVAGAITTSTAKSDVEGIDGGEGDDTLINNSNVLAFADSTAVSAAVSVGVFGVALAADATWEGGTVANALSDGIAGGAGDDTITNNSLVDTDARARANSIQVAATGIGISVANSASNAFARSNALEGGTGNDTITNLADITSDAVAHATSVGVSVTGGGATASIDSGWDNGTVSNAIARGIAGSAGNDVLDNSARIGVNAESDADSAQIAATGVLIAVASASSTAESTGIGIAGGDGLNTITNSGEIDVVSDADAQSTAIAYTVTTGASGTDPFIENLTSANANANGITGGADVDTITTEDSSTITLTANALARDNDVAGVFLLGFSSADARSMAESFATGVNGGAGDDVIDLSGTIDATATSEANSRAIAFNTSIGNSLKAGTSSEATATGVAGGDGNDTITNNAAVTVSGTATNLGRTVGITVAGGTVGLAESEATTMLQGIDLGDGDNSLENDGDVTATSTTNVTARSFGLAGIGFAGTNAQADSTSNAFGVTAGDGADSISNTASIVAMSTSNSDANGVSFNLVGAGISDNVITSTSNATGMSTNAGIDTIDNTGSIAANAVANGTIAGGFQFSVVGAGIGNGLATTTSNAIGVSTGDDADVVTNGLNASITASATSTSTTAGSLSITVAGFSDNDLTGNVEAVSTGLVLGAGDDTVINDGSIDVESRTDSTVTAGNITIAGDGGAVVGSDATTRATGIDSGDGEDNIINNGDIEVGVTDAENMADDWMAVLEIGSSSFTGAGVAGSNSTAIATTESLGINGGAANDRISNIGNLRVFANSFSNSTASSINIFGTAGSTEDAGASSRAFGITGGDGMDFIDNSGVLLVSARTKLVLDGSSYRLGGAGTTSGTLAASTRVFGMVGGDGDDFLMNSGSLTARGVSEMMSTGNSNTTFGGSTAAASSGGTTGVTGISGGAGNDSILNLGPGAVMDVEASVDVETGSSSYSFVGTPSSGAVITGNAAAVGANGGDGADFIDSDGSVTVAANASLLATGGARSTIGGGATTIGEATTGATATGFAGEDGDDIIRSAGILSVVSDSRAASQNTAGSGADIISSSRAQAKSRATSTAVGFAGGAGANALNNSDDAFVSARSSGNAVAYANGATVSITGTATAITTSTASATATGMNAADGDNTVINRAGLTVSADAGTTQPIQTTIEVLSIEQNANPDTVDPTEAPDYEGADLPVLPDDTEYPEGAVVFWNGEQDASGNGPIDDPLVGPPGAHYIVVRTETTASDGTVTVAWEWQPVLVTAYQRDYFAEGHPTDAVGRGKGANGNGVGRSTGTTTALAKGIELGDGNNYVRNDGELIVTADANSEVTASASGSITGDATAEATATASADAVGIVLGEGNNTVVNNGDLSVTAIARTSATAIAAPGAGLCIPLLFWEICIAPGSSSESTTETRSVTAVGITTGAGNNSILNNGSITVVARANNPGTATVVGVQTQSGDDTVTNNGLISATTENLAGVVLGSGIGIDTGAGNDTVQLGDGSLVVGTVSLGDDDDTLWLSGSAAIENYLGELLNPDGGAGNDHLILSGMGDFFAVPESFERATKRDAGTFWLNELPTVDALTIDGGTLELGTAYSFAQDGTFSTFIHSNGDRGELLVNGIATLAGSIEVEHRGDDFIDDGTRYSVVNSTDPLLGDFSSVTLPDALPLLSFAFERQDSSVDVIAVAASFQTVADSSLQMAVASNLDQLAPLSAGDFREQFGTIQSMESGFGSALDSLSPDSNLVLTTNTIAIAHQTTQLLRTHLGNARAVLRGTRSESAAYSPVALYYDGVQMAATDASESRAYAAGPSNTSKRVASESRAETWLMAFGGSGDIDLVDGYTDYDQDMAGFAAGADYLFGNNFIAGFSLEIAESKLKMQRAVAKTDIESWGGSLYATAFWEKSYVEGGISFGRQDFSSQRVLSIDGVSSDIVSKHDGNSTMAFLGAGRAFTFSDWTVEPYATLYYFDVSEDGFVEEGAGSLNQLVEKKSANTLLGEVGTTFSLLRPAGNGFLDWHTTLAYNHDFDIDTSSISYAYEGAPTTFFSISGRNVVSGSAVIGAGLAYQNGRSILSLDYRGQFSGDYEQHILGARLVYVFR